MPSHASLPDGKASDIGLAKTLNYVSGFVLVMDRCCVYFEWLFNMESKGLIFVTGLKGNQNYEPVQEYHLDPRKANKDMDQDVRLTGSQASEQQRASQKGYV